MIGSVIGPYRVTATLGAGGMRKVYLATDTTLGRQVAITVLPLAVAADAERLARFEREARTLAAISHLNISAIYGVERAVHATLDPVFQSGSETTCGSHQRAGPGGRRCRT